MDLAAAKSATGVVPLPITLTGMKLWLNENQNLLPAPSSR